MTQEGESEYLEELLRDSENEIRAVNQFLFNPALLVLEDAFCCSAHACYLASVVMSRGALAGMLHILRVWVYHEYESRYEISRDKRFRLEDLIKWAYVHGWFDDNQETMAREIQAIGNLGAHIVERLNEDLAEIARPAHVPVGFYVTKIKINEATSFELLKKTTRLLVELAKALQTRRELVPLPAWF